MNQNLRNFTISRTLFIAAFAILEQFGIIHFYLIFDSKIEYAIGIYIILHIAYALILPFIAKIIEKMGVRSSMIFAILTAMLSSVPLFFTEQNRNLIIAWLILTIIWRSFYFIPFHYFTSKFTTGKHRGSEIGIINGLGILAIGLTPVISGYVSSQFQLGGLAVLAGFLSLLSVFPLIKIENFHFSYTKGIRTIIAAPGMVKVLLLLALNFAQQNINKFWYLFLFLFFENDFGKFGLITTAAILLSALISYIFGKFLDHHNRKTIIHYESILNSLAWSFRLVANTPILLVAADTFYKVNRYIKDDAVDIINVDIINRQHHDETLDERITARQITGNLAIALALTIALVVVIATDDIRSAFIVSIFLSFLFYLVK